MKMEKIMYKIKLTEDMENCTNDFLVKKKEIEDLLKEIEYRMKTGRNIKPDLLSIKELTSKIDRVMIKYHKANVSFLEIIKQDT